MLAKKLRLLLHDFRLGSVVYALFTLGSEYASQLLKSEAKGCDCAHDIPNGLYRCISNRQHAVTEITLQEEFHARRNQN